MKRFKLFAMSLLATLALLLAACGGGGEETAPGAPDGEVPGVTGTEQAVPGQEETEPSVADAETEDATEPAAGVEVTETPSTTEPMTDTEETEPLTDTEESEPMTDTEDTEPMTDTEESEPMTDTEESETPTAEETETLDDSDTMTDTTESETMTDTTDTELSTAAEAGVQSSMVADFGVVSSDDQELGSIEDLVIDPQTGQVNYALVSIAGGVGLAAEVIPVPWDQLELQEDQQAFVLDVDQVTLEEAPAYDEFPPAQSGWESEVEQYWENNASIGTNDSSESDESQ